MMKSFVWQSDPRFKIFNNYYTGEAEHNFQKLFICHFNGWLDRSGYTRYIENATVEEEKVINEKRLSFFSSFFDTCVVLDRQSNRFVQPKNIKEFKSH